MASLKQTLTHKSRFADPSDPPMHLYDESRPGYLGLPRERGLSWFPRLEMIDRTTMGQSIICPTRPDPNHPRVLDPVAQAKFMVDLLVAFQTHRSFIARAPTGSGKTTCALNTSAELGRTTLILVHLERLMDQWIEEIQAKLGVPMSRIGIAQQDKSEWEGKDFTVGLLHSVANRQYSPQFYDAFGMVICDEVHKIGTQFFVPAITRFPSYYRLGISATPYRKDGGTKVFFYHLGQERVVSTASNMPMKVYTIPYTTTRPLWGRTGPARVQCLTKDAARNILLVRIIKRFYDQGRVALIVSSSVSHLQVLMAMAVRAGVPAALMGQFTASKVVGSKLVPAVDAETGHHVVNKDGSPRMQEVSVTRPVAKASLAQVKAEAQMIFATYGMITEGIDIPRLDAGLDATPRADANQLSGRIRRPVPGKKMPMWVTILDTECAMSQRWYNARCRDYLATQAEVVPYDGTKTSGTDNRATGRAQGEILGSRAEQAPAGPVCQRPELPSGGAQPRPPRLPHQAGRIGQIRARGRLPG